MMVSAVFNCQVSVSWRLGILHGGGWQSEDLCVYKYHSLLRINLHYGHRIRSEIPAGYHRVVCLSRQCLDVFGNVWTPIRHVFGRL